MKLKISNITPDNRVLLDDILDLCELRGCGNDLPDGSFNTYNFEVDGVSGLGIACFEFVELIESLIQNNFKVEVLKH